MELTVSYVRLIYDIVLLLAMGYIWLFFAKRWNRYTSELRPFVRNATIFLGLGVIGRLLDLITDFMNVPQQDNLFVGLYGISILGVIYTMVDYMLLLERKYLPTRVPVTSKPTSQDSRLKGAYLAFGSKSKMVDIFNLIRSLKLPTLAFTRNPQLYSGMDFVAPVWVTQATDRGVPPTKLHVIQDQAISFVRENPESVVLIDCLEYLLLYNDFTSVFKFLVNLKDHLLPAGAALIVIVDENALDERQKALLLREFEPL